MRLSLFALFLSLAAAGRAQDAAPASEQALEVDIVGGISQPLPIAVPMMPTPRSTQTAEGDTASLGRQVAEIVAGDLRSSGLFTPADRTVRSALVGQPLPAFTLAALVAGKPGLVTADLRRGQPDWAPRELDDKDVDAVWRAIRLGGKALVRPAGVPVEIRRSDTGATATLRRGGDPVTVEGPVADISLFLFGRRQVRDLTFAGPPERVASVRGAELGF